MEASLYFISGNVAGLKYTSKKEVNYFVHNQDMYETVFKFLCLYIYIYIYIYIAQKIRGTCVVASSIRTLIW